ncbi:MAG TPA: hypothetical protein VFQ95_02955, partial [Rhodanobacteraceae bacterium]|nr:hypothetical protein [Rhodanobacteraceae bacterium]
TAMCVLDRLRARDDQAPWAVVATAHAAKFASVVEPLAERPIAVPRALALMLERPAQAEPLAADATALAAWLHGHPASPRPVPRSRGRLDVQTSDIPA